MKNNIFFVSSLVLMLVACETQNQEVESDDAPSLETWESLSKSFVGSVESVRSYSLPSKYSQGTLHQGRGLQPNIIYIPYSPSTTYDFIVWNGNDNADHDTVGNPQPDAISPGQSDNGDGLYIGRVTLNGTPAIELVHYYPPQSVVAHKPFKVDTSGSLYPSRLLGATLDANNNLNIARTLGNDVFLHTIPTAQLIANALPTSITQTTVTVNQKLDAGVSEKREYEIMTEVRDSESTTPCMGSAVLASSSSTPSLTLAYDRGYTFDSAGSVIGEPFARYDVYVPNGNSWSLMQQNSTRILDMQEVKTVRTHRACSEAVAYHTQHQEVVIASYTDVGNIRISFIDLENRLQSKLYLLRDTVYRNTMDIVALLPIVDDLPLSDGSTSGRAYILLLRYTNTDKLATYGRENNSLAFFVISNGNLIPSSDSSDSIHFVFPDLDGGVGEITAGLASGTSSSIGGAQNLIAVRSERYLALLNTKGEVVYGPFAVDGSYGTSRQKDAMFSHVDGSLGWVDYLTNAATSNIKVFSYKAP